MGVRISRETPCSPLTPEGCADIKLGLESLESLRVLTLFGNQSSFGITNTRPIHMMAVAIGEAEYPRLEDLKDSIDRLSQKAWDMDASRIAINMGAPPLTNIIMIGALIGIGLLPIDGEMFEYQLQANFKEEHVVLNIKTFEMGIGEIVSQVDGFCGLDRGNSRRTR
jgi:indolepyruvate ferredoxin oxidoreductase beta subunit